MNVICTFIIRCFRICLSPSFLSSSLDELRKLFLQNGYPSGMLNYNINDVTEQAKKKDPNSQPPQSPKRKILLILSYYRAEFSPNN